MPESATLIHRTVTGAYDPASETCFTISFMMRGFKTRWIAVIQFSCRFRLLRRLPELIHIWVSDRSLDRSNNLIERPCGDHREPFHFHLSDHSDSFLFLPCLADLWAAGLVR